MHGLIRQTGKGCRFECCFLPIKNTNNDINFLYVIRRRKDHMYIRIKV